MRRSPPARVIVTATVASRDERSSMLTRLAVRVLLATGIIDRAYRNFDLGRSELVAALASDEALDRYNDVAYGRTGAYHPEGSVFRAYLFPWEEEVLDRFFPPPPAHILVGGAGGGREAFALLERGYHVTAFEPSEKLAAAMAAASEGVNLSVYRGAYENLPRIEPLNAALPDDIEKLGPFDASVLGWGSFSHLRTEPDRERALQSFGRVTHGPILVSFLGLYQPDRPSRSRLAVLRRYLPRRAGRRPGDVFSTSMGFFHRTNEAEVQALARRTRLEIVHARFDERDTNWPYVVLRRRDGETSR